MANQRSLPVHRLRQMAKVGDAASTALQAALRPARSLGFPDLPLVVIPHPFGSRSRDEVRAMAQPCVAEIVRALQ